MGVNFKIMLSEKNELQKAIYCPILLTQLPR